MHSAKRNVWVFVDNKWDKGYLLSPVRRSSSVNGVSVGGKQRVQVQVRDSQMFTTKWAPQKYNGKRFNGYTEVIPKPSLRLPRFVMPCIQIIPVCFLRPEEYGDFAWMVKQVAYCDCLFVYNENLLQWADELDFRPGGGNAVIRPYRNTQAIGIPTGYQEGFKYLDADVCNIVQKAMQGIANRVVDRGYTTIFYSCGHIHDLARDYSQLSRDTRDICGEHALIGTGIFNVSLEVRAYITRMLLATEVRVREQLMKRRASMRYSVA